MSRTTATTCDGCGRQQAISTEDIYAGKQGKEPFWSLSYHSSDFPTEREGFKGYRMISGGWDLCTPCTTKARAALMASIGDPNHDSWDEAMGKDAELGILGKAMLEGHSTDG